MRTAILLPLALGLSACASTQSILEREPDEVFTSEKSPASVAGCLGDLNNIPVLPQDGGGYVVAVKSLVGMTGYVFTVEPLDEGSRLTVRRANTPIMMASYKRCL